MKTTVFLGGTCNGSSWRDQLIPMLKENVDAFNPVVKDWTPECQKIELEKRESSNYVVYVITPKMTGVYSIAEVVDDSNKRPQSTILCVLQHDDDKSFDNHQMKSLQAVEKLVRDNGSCVCFSLQEISNELNKLAWLNEIKEVES